MERSIDVQRRGRRGHRGLLGLSLLVGLAGGVASCERHGQVASPHDARGRTRIAGSVHGVDGAALQLGHVRVIDPATQEADAVTLGRGGRFRLSTRHRGFALLEFTGVDHAAMRVPVWLDGDAIELDMRLGTYPPAGKDEGLFAMVWSGPPGESEPTQHPLVRGADGHARVEIDGVDDPARVQLMGFAAEGRAVNVPGTSRFEYDGGGDYVSLVPVTKGKLVLDVDLNRRAPTREPRLHFADPNGLAARVAALGEHWPPRIGSGPGDATALWRAAASSDRSPLRRAAVAMALELEAREFEGLSPGEQALAIAAVEDTPYGDSLWALAPRGLVMTAQATGRADLMARVDRVLGEQLPPELVGMLLVERLSLAADRGDAPQQRRLWAQLQQPRYAELGLLDMAAAWRPDRKVARGGHVPSFDAPALVGATARVRDADLAGKVVLIELWATWCGPCVEGMPELHALHEHFGGEPPQGRAAFDIVSISMDDSADDVARFRKTWPMPWTHAFAGDARDQLYTAFETGTLPYAVLVDEHGTILDASAHLDAAHLRELLTTHFAGSAPVADTP